MIKFNCFLFLRHAFNALGAEDERLWPNESTIQNH